MYLCFTLIFKRNDGYQEPFQLIYEPCPCGKKGDKCIINFNESPHYQKGSFKEFIKHIKSIDSEKQCILSGKEISREFEISRSVNDLL